MMSMLSRVARRCRWVAATVALLGLPAFACGGHISESSRVDRLAEALDEGDADAASMLELLFDTPTTSVSQKRKIAWLLVTHRPDSRRYIEFLTQEARTAINDTMPSPFLVIDGVVQRDGFDKKFVQWCEANKISVADGFRRATVELPQAVVWLAQLRDARVFDVLVEGLKSKNPTIVWHCAHGLGRLGDTRAITPLVEAARRASPDAALGPVQGLAYFDEELARQVGREVVSDPTLLERLRPGLQQNPR